MNIKPKDVEKLKKSIISVFNSDTPPSYDLKRAFVFRADMIYLCGKAAKVIQDQNKRLIYCIIMYPLLLIIVGFNLNTYYHNPIKDDLSMLLLLHALISVWFGFIFYGAIEEIGLRKKNAVFILTDFYQRHFAIITRQEPNLKSKLRLVNKAESKKGFEASWRFLLKFKK